MKKLIYFSLILAVAIGIFAQDEQVAPLPDPPSIAKRVLLSDLIVHVKLKHSREIKIGNFQISQPRFEVIRVLFTSKYFVLKNGEFFTVNHLLKPTEWGPFFQEAPEPGEYVVFLQVKNIQLENRTLYYPELIMPHPFALESTEETPVEDVRKAISAESE